MTYGKICEGFYKKTGIENFHNFAQRFIKMARVKSRPIGSKKHIRTPEQALKDIKGVE